MMECLVFWGRTHRCDKPAGHQGPHDYGPSRWGAPVNAEVLARLRRDGAITQRNGEWFVEVHQTDLEEAVEAVASLTAQNEKLRTEVENAYTERNLLVAHLFRQFPPGIAWWADAPDAEGYVIVYLETDEGQLSWHMKVEEAQTIMFGGLGYYAKDAGKWDGHTTDEKYARLERLDLR